MIIFEMLKTGVCQFKLNNYCQRLAGKRSKGKAFDSNISLALLRLAICCTKSRPRQDLGTG